MNPRAILLVFRKEILDLVRDRKALFFMIILPMLAMPLLMAGITRLSISQAKKTRERSLIVQTTPEERDRFTGLLRAELGLNDQTLELALSFLGEDFAAVARKIAQDTGTTLFDVLSQGRDDPRIREHPDFATLKGLMPDALRSMRRAMSRDDGNGAAAQEEDGPEGEQEPASPSEIAADLLASSTPEQREAVVRLSDLLSPLHTIDYVTSEEAAALPATKLAVPLEDLTPEVIEDPVMAQAAQDITARRIHAFLKVPESFGTGLAREDGSVSVQIVYDSTIPLSEEAYRRLRAAVERLSSSILRQRLLARNLSEDFTTPAEVTASNVAPPKKQALQVLAGFLPYMIILMCFFGGFYPAIDVGAGEKERKTLESLLVTPVSRLEISLGKFLVVFAASLVAALCATASLAYTFQSGLAPPELREQIAFHLDASAAILCVLLIVPTAAIFASALLSLSIYAKSFKEAQAMMAPVQFLVIIPAVISLIPGIELSYQLALVPVLNIALALREVLGGGGVLPPAGQILTIFASTAILAALALAFCARFFDKEKVLFRS